ncbi:MAG: hypothetical protein WCF03_02845 [Nitrososphaeraceae archaeon]
MTYILGSRCKDGVVLVADTKITVDDGARYDYDDKITGDIRGVLIGFSGNKEPFTEFGMRLRERAKELESNFNRKEKISIDRINLLIGGTMKSLEGHYGRNYIYDILAGISGMEHSELTYFYQNGSPEKVRKYKAIGVWTYGSIFLQENWDENMSMETVGGIGYFIIRYMEKFGLDLGVGTGGKKPNPQIKFLPDNAYDIDASTQQIQKFEEDSKRNLERLSSQFKLDFCS